VKLICIEEHAIDPAIAQAAQPALQREAPYMSLQNSHRAAPRPGDRPSMVEMTEAVKLLQHTSPARPARTSRDAYPGREQPAC
jgi:uncharacterized protein